MPYLYCKNCKTHSVEHIARELMFNAGDLSYPNHSKPIRKIGNKDINLDNAREKLYYFTCNRCDYATFRFSNDAEQFYPIEPMGEPIHDFISEDIRKDFDEARLIANHSIRCANILLRICTEKILDFIGEKFMQEDIEKIKTSKLFDKIKIIKSKNPGLNTKVFTMIDILRKYGNDNAHSIREIDESDTIESFNILAKFIHHICKDIVNMIELDCDIEKMHNNIS
jgi:hypothetical protein